MAESEDMAIVDYSTDGDIAVLTVNNPPVNAISVAVRAGLIEGLDQACADEAIRAVVIIGGGRTYMAGADIKEFGKGPLSPTFRDVQNRIEAANKPVLSALHGTALGGGLEIALTCHYRVAAAQTQFGLPEVKLGLLPGAGGTQRLTRLIGPAQALELITSGGSFDTAFALASGVIDAVVETDLRAGAVAFARDIAGQRPLPLVSVRGDRIGDVDRQLFADFRQRNARRFRGLFAPQKIVECIEAACYRSAAEGFQFEEEAFQACLDSPQRQALIHLFFAERAARKIPGVGADIKPLPIHRAAVIGAGTMGAGIAMCFANAGIPVALIDISAEAVQRGLAAIEKNYAASVARGSMSEADKIRALALIEGADHYGPVARADFVVEAVFEKLELKQRIFAELDRNAPPHAILGSNTSSLDIDAIAAATRRPDKVLGTHFFSPANVMKLLETVRGAHSSQQTLVTALTLAQRLGKVPVVAGNCEFFIGNRLIEVYLAQAEFLLEEGCTPEQIDRVAEQFGFAMGPLAVRDLAGCDVGLLIRQGRRFPLPAGERYSPLIERLVALGRLGQKTGKGIYDYDGRKRVPSPEVQNLIEGISRELGIERRAISDAEILARLLHPMVNEGARILEEGMAARASDIDLVYVNGYGFPPYRGGPMFWAQKIGLDQVLATATSLAEKFGASWRPSVLLERLVREGKGWDSVEQRAG